MHEALPAFAAYILPSLMSTLAAVAPMMVLGATAAENRSHVKSQRIILRLRGQPQPAVRHYLENSCHFFRASEKF